MSDRVNNILIDWLSFTSKSLSLSQILDLLGFEDSDSILWQRCNGFYGYRDRINFDGINIHYNPFKIEMGILVEMSGKGCRRFEESSSINFSSLFHTLVSDSDDFNITRLDVAYDDFESILDVNQIISDVHNFNFVSKFQARSIRIEEHAGHTGQTVYFGSQKSAVMFRLYDKAYERNREEEGSWYRFEIQLRGDRAFNFVFAYVNGSSIGHLFFGVINNYLRFVVPDQDHHDSRKRRWSTAPYWSKWLAHLEKISLYTSHTTEYNLFRTERYVHKQCSNSIEALINSKGVYNFLHDMFYDKPVYSEKYQQISENSGAILSFLECRGGF